MRIRQFLNASQLTGARDRWIGRCIVRESIKQGGRLLQENDSFISENGRMTRIHCYRLKVTWQELQ